MSIARLQLNNTKSSTFSYREKWSESLQRVHACLNDNPLSSSDINVRVQA